MRRFRYCRTRIPLRFLLFAALIAVAAVWIYAASQLQPTLSRVAVTRVSNAVNRVVVRAVNEAVDSGTVSYEQLIAFEKDNNGRIAALRSNLAACNRLQAEILDIILTRIEEVPARDLSIPVGTLLNSALFAGRGPRISVRMESVGTSSARFESAFVSAGINQTRHEIILHIDVSVSILLPGFTTATVVSNAVTVAETVIVGAVPESYACFSADSADDAKDYMMNG